MPLAHAFGLAGGDQPVPRVLADRFQHHKARFAVGLGLLHQALADQRFHGLENTQRGFDIADCVYRFQGAASDKHGEPPEQFLLVGGEQVMAPIDRPAQRLLPCRQVARPAHEKAQPMAELREHALRRQHPHPRRGEFDRQRQAVEPVADLRHRGSVLVGDREGGLHRHRALDEQGHRFVLGQSIQRRQASEVGQRQGRNGIIRLAGQTQHFPAGDQHFQAWRSAQELAEQWRGIDHLLEVVQHQQHLFPAQVVFELFLQLAAGGFAYVEGLGDRLQHQRRIAQRRQGDEKHPLLEFIHHVGGGLQGEAGLAGAADPGQGQQAHLGVGQLFLDGANLVLATDEGGGLRRQIVGARIERLERREVDREIGRNELKDALRSDQVLQSPLAHVAQRDIGRKMIAHQFLGGQRQQDLSAVRCFHQPRRAVQRRAIVITTALFRRAAVQGHPRLDGEVAPGVGLQRPLRGKTRRNRIGRDRKRRMGTVASGLDDIAVVSLDGVAQDLIVVRQRLLHRRVLRLPQPRAALDVGEQERDRAGRQKTVSWCQRHGAFSTKATGSTFLPGSRSP